MDIRVIVEYAHLDYAERGDDFDIFDEKEYGDHSYWGPIISDLKRSRGAYVFYDSLAVPLYFGIAPSRSLWTRANESFNHERIKRPMLMVKHPYKNVRAPEKTRKIVRSGFRLADVATYFSAYEVSQDLIGGLEAFCIRALGGGLLNIKIEGNGGFGLSKPEVE